MLAVQTPNRSSGTIRGVPIAQHPPLARPGGLLPGLWRLEPGIRFLNHGSFGAVPEPVWRVCGEWRERVEARPIEVLGRRIGEYLEPVRRVVADFLGTDASRLGLVTNATAACNSALAAIDWAPGDRILFVNHGYNAIRQAIHHHATSRGAVLDVVDLEWPVGDSASIVRQVMGGVRDRTRLLVLDQVMSPTAIVMPAAAIVERARAHGVMTLVDGAHAPGMLPLDVDALGADWWCGNLHKWCYAPKGCAVMVVSERQRDRTHPPVVSHHLGQGFAQEFGWQGTFDPAPWLCAEAAIRFTVEAAGGQLRAHNCSLARWAHDMLCDRLGEAPLVRDDIGQRYGSMACVRVPDRVRSRFPSAAALQAWLYGERRIEIPVIDFGGWHVRLSAAPYNGPEDYEALAEALAA